MLGRKLSRYLVRETFWLYLLGVSAFCLLLSIDLLTIWARWFVEYDAGLGDVGRLMLYKLPMFLHFSLPVAVVFAVLLATGRLAKDSELKAAYASGVPPLTLLSPVILFGLVVSLLAVVNNGYLEPLGTEAEETLVNTFYYDRPPPETQSNVAYRVPDVGIYYAGRVRADEEDPDQAELSGALVIQTDGTKITAPEGVWNSTRDVQTWTLYGAQVTAPDGTVRLEPELSFPFNNETQASESLTDSEQLTLSELWRRLATAQRSGGETRDLLFTFHRRLADAFSAVIFALIAGALGLYLHGRSAGFGWTIVLIVLFWSVWTLSGNFYEQRVLSPIVAAWFTSGFVGAIALAVAWLRLR